MTHRCAEPSSTSSWVVQSACCPSRQDLRLPDARNSPQSLPEAALYRDGRSAVRGASRMVDSLPVVWVVETNASDVHAVCESLAGAASCEILSPADATARLAAGAQPTVVVVGETRGLSVIQAIRTSHDELELPIVLVSSDRGDELSGLAAGANDVVIAPFVPAVLRLRVAARVRVQSLGRRRGDQALLEALAAQPLLIVCSLKGPKLIFQNANDAYLALIGADRSIIGKPLREAIPRERSDAVTPRLLEVLETCVPYTSPSIATEIARSDGTRAIHHFQVVYQPVCSTPGVADGVLVLALDITERVRAHESVQRAQADAASRAEFERQLIGIVSHDLRNPLSTILLGTQVLTAGEGTSERVLKVLGRIQSAAERGARMVSDLLDFTQARVGGGIPVVPQACNLHTLVRQVVDDLGMTVPDRDVEVITSGDGQGMWDPDRMSQVLHNLISNALRYSAPGSIVGVRSVGDADGVTVSVHNHGEPIDEAARSRIFQPMQRATAQLENKARSVGLGLFIVKQLVEAHGGSISVHSTAADGTTFSFRVPRSFVTQG